MREIKFRAKELHEPSKWHYGYYIKHKLNNPCPVMFEGETPKDKEIKYEEYLIVEYDGDWNMESVQYKVKIKPETIGQFTGLQDKNRKDIYEGDIVLVSGITYGVIDYLNKYAMFNIDYGNSGKPMALDLLNPKDYYLEVVGNIYDNPELLEKV